MRPWYACAEPERPTDPYIIWHYQDGDRCIGCSVKAGLLLRLYPDDLHVQWVNARLSGAAHDAGEAQ